MRLCFPVASRLLSGGHHLPGRVQVHAIERAKRRYILQRSIMMRDCDLRFGACRVPRGYFIYEIQITRRYPPCVPCSVAATPRLCRIKRPRRPRNTKARRWAGPTSFSSSPVRGSRNCVTQRSRKRQLYGYTEIEVEIFNDRKRIHPTELHSLVRRRRVERFLVHGWEENLFAALDNHPCWLFSCSHFCYVVF